jgi:hypothetical protein
MLDVLTMRHSFQWRVEIPTIVMKFETPFDLHEKPAKFNSEEYL